MVAGRLFWSMKLRGGSVPDMLPVAGELQTSDQCVGYFSVLVISTVLHPGQLFLTSLQWGMKLVRRSYAILRKIRFMCRPLARTGGDSCCCRSKLASAKNLLSGLVTSLRPEQLIEARQTLQPDAAAVYALQIYCRERQERHCYLAPDTHELSLRKYIELEVGFSMAGRLEHCMMRDSLRSCIEVHCPTSSVQNRKRSLMQAFLLCAPSPCLGFIAPSCVAEDAAQVSHHPLW